MRTATLELNHRNEFASSRPANFNRLARVYRWLEWFTFGPILWKCRCAYLAEMKHRRSALVIGDGDGRFTVKLLEENPHIAVDAVDASDSMLRRLMQNAGNNAGRVHSHLADARQLHFAARKFDLVATHFFLDCLTTADVESLAMRLREALTSDATWVVSEFAVPDNRYGRFIARPIVTALYFAFGCLTGLTIRELPRHHEALQRAGFILTNERKWLSGLLVSELWKPGPQ
jgi:SAM-dependent methyltransferase